MSQKNRKPEKLRDQGDLHFVLITPDMGQMVRSLIPRYLIEQARSHLLWEPHEFYEVYPLHAASPYNLLYTLCNNRGEVKGILWFQVLPMGRKFMVNLVSIDRKYQGRDFLRKMIVPFMKSLVERLNIQKAIFATTRPQVFKRLGFAPSQVALMEA